jgi:NTP pyrophosphatase (non-canonical NTP hydrolase)
MSITNQKPLDFNALRAANVARCEESFHPLDAWTPEQWALAVAGEVGSVAHVIKKAATYANSGLATAALKAELADVAIYLDLLAARCRIDLGEAVREKFNAVSDAKGSKQML